MVESLQCRAAKQTSYPQGYGKKEPEVEVVEQVFPCMIKRVVVPDGANVFAQRNDASDIERRLLEQELHIGSFGRLVEIMRVEQLRELGGSVSKDLRIRSEGFSSKGWLQHGAPM